LVTHQDSLLVGRWSLITGPGVSNIFIDRDQCANHFTMLPIAVKIFFVREDIFSRCCLLDNRKCIQPVQTPVSTNHFLRNWPYIRFACKTKKNCLWSAFWKF